MANAAPPGAALGFRRAAPSDAEVIARLARRSFSDPWSPDSFRSELEQARVRGYLAELGGAICAYLVGSLVLDSFELRSLAVDPELRRQGLMRALLAHSLRELEAGGARRLILEVRASNRPARALYEELGLRVEGRRPRYYIDGEDAMLYGGSLARALARAAREAREGSATAEVA